MRFGLNILSTILHSFGSRKVTSSVRGAHLPNIFARRDPHAAARSAKLRAARSTGRIRNGRTASATWRTADPVHGTKAHRRAPRPLRRCNNVIIPRPRRQPQPQLPGAYEPEPSFFVPSIFPEVDDRHLAPLVQQKLFLDALYAGRLTLLRAEEERREAAKARKRAEDEEYARLLERDSKKAREAQRRAEEEEYARLLEEDRRKAREAQRRAEEEEFLRLQEENRRRAQEAQRRAEAEEAARRERERVEEERRRRAEHEAFRERERRERERQERERQYRERKSKAESVQHHLVERLRVYEETWAALRSNAAGMKPLRFRDIPWPVFGNVWSGNDVTEERVREFVCHPLHEYMRTPGGGQAKATRLELLRWHPDKFNGKVLNRVVEADREAVQDAAANIVHILNELGAGKR